MKKRLLAILLMISMIVSLVPTVMAAEADLTISSAADLQAFADAVNGGDSYEGKKVVLAASIELTGEWTPIGNATIDSPSYTGNAFKGTFDGGNNTISGLTNSLFGVVDGATVENLVLSDVAISGSDDRVGAAVRLMVGNATVSDIKVSGAVSGTKYVGGIVGAMTYDGTISGCINDATIDGSTYNIGGIVGAAYYTAEGKTMIVSGCTNNGTVSGPYGVGGIVGLSAADISNCTNTAAITGSNMDIGGIVGEQKVAGSVIGCINTAAITNSGTGYGTGGIIGWIRYPGYPSADYGFGEVIEVSGNVNRGAVTGGADAGGIVGVVYNAANVTGNENTALKIRATTFASGIVGSMQFTETVGSDIPQQTVSVYNNVSTTAIENITASGACTDLYVYDNSSGSQTGTVSGNSTGWVAEVDSVKYTALKAAINAAEDGDTVKLLASHEDFRAVQVGKSIAVNLNGFDIVRTFGGAALDITDGSVTVLGDGKISGATDGILVAYDAELKLEKGVTVEGRNGHGVDNDGRLTVDGATITATKYGIVLYSDAENNNWAASLDMLDGSVSGECGIAAYANTTVTVKGGTVTGTVAGLSGEGGSHGTTFTILGGTIQSEEGVGIYHPQNGALNIGGGTIKGATGINIKSGNVTVTGGDIIGTGEKADYSFVGGGFNITGDALVIESCGYPGGAPTASISGGMFSSTNAAAVASYAGNGVSESITGFITGGDYSDESADKYLADGYALDSYVDGNDNTVYGVEPVYTVTISIPNDATIVVEDAGGNDIAAEDDGTYELVNGNYTYTVVKENYVSKTGSFVVNGEAQSVVIDLDLVTYTVTYRDGDKVLFTETIEHGKDATLPAIPEKEGYTQLAPTWDKDGKNITADTEINAVYTINEYTITFIDENGVYKTLTCKHGETITMPDVPTKNGYAVKWETTIDRAIGDATIKAVYTENVVTDSPQTGDNSNAALWFILMIVSGAACIFLFVKDRRYRRGARV